MNKTERKLGMVVPAYIEATFIFGLRPSCYQVRTDWKSRMRARLIHVLVCRRGGKAHGMGQKYEWTEEELIANSERCKQKWSAR